MQIDANTHIAEGEIEISAIRAQGAGGQNVNKVSSAVHLRFDVPASSLPDNYKRKLQELKDRRISKDGIIVIKAQRYRSQDKNRDDALSRLRELIVRAMAENTRRIPTKPTRGSQLRRMDRKTRRGRVKALRRPVDD